MQIELQLARQFILYHFNVVQAIVRARSRLSKKGA